MGCRSEKFIIIIIIIMIMHTQQQNICSRFAWCSSRGCFGASLIQEAVMLRQLCFSEE